MAKSFFAYMLQVKNRSNSENSSSKKVRKGTPIKLWFRIDAKTGDPKWQNFPDAGSVDLLSEEGFRAYIREVASSWGKEAGKRFA